MIVNGFLFVGCKHEQKLIKLADIQMIETHGTEGKPTGMCDSYAAVIVMRDGVSAGLNDGEWAETKSDLEFPETGALGCPPPFNPKDVHR